MDVLDYQVEYNLSDAHNWIERHHVTKKILTYKGKKDNAELKLDYNPVWEEVKLLKATVTNGDQVKEVSKQETNLMDAGWVASAPRYPAAKTLVASLPAVEVGSVIEYEFERLKRDRPFFAATHIFRGFDPIDQETMKLTAPASLDLQVSEGRQRRGRARRDDGRTGDCRDARNARTARPPGNGRWASRRRSNPRTRCLPCRASIRSCGSRREAGRCTRSRCSRP